MEKLVEYLKSTYAPLSIIVYGSYADGSHNQHSDFDALVIVAEGEACHDTSLVDGVRLDVFVYPAASLEGEFDCDAVVQIFDGQIVLDTDGCGAALVSRVQAYIGSLPAKSKAEVRESIAWCEKMLLRSQRGDAEGLFRGHWLLVDSLEIYCDASRRRYLGPKKTLRWMEAQEPEAFACYTRALREFSAESLQNWIECLKNRP